MRWNSMQYTNTPPSPPPYIRIHKLYFLMGAGLATYYDLLHINTYIDPDTTLNYIILFYVLHAREQGIPIFEFVSFAPVGRESLYIFMMLSRVTNNGLVHTHTHTL